MASSGSWFMNFPISTTAFGSITANGSGLWSEISRIRSPNWFFTRSSICSDSIYSGSRDLLAIAVAVGRADQPSLGHHLLLQLEQALGKSLGTRRASGHVHIDRQDFIDAVANRVGKLEKSSAARARTHRDDVSRLGHLVVEQPRPERHFQGQRAGDDHQVRLARGRARRRAETIDV